MEEPTSVVKKTARTKKTATQSAGASVETTVSSPVLAAQSAAIIQVFDDLMSKIIRGKQEYDNLQKEISQIKLDWVREQKQHEVEIIQQKTQEELERKRENETYTYNTTLSRKRVEDEFLDRKLGWEKDLAQRKQELEDQRKELEELRKLAVSFEGQKETAAKEAQVKLEKELAEKYGNEKRLKEQEVKAEKDLLNMRIANLETENSRLNKEIEIIKRSFDEATRQVREIAVKVIESGSQPKNPG